MTINSTSRNPCAALEKVFHEPARLAITSALCQADEGLTFAELKQGCTLTDGNLSRHLKVLREAEAVISIKTSEGRPQTRVYLSDRGRRDFIAYLGVLEAVLSRAADALDSQEIAHPTPAFMASPLSI